MSLMIVSKDERDVVSEGEKWRDTLRELSRALSGAIGTQVSEGEGASWETWIYSLIRSRDYIDTEEGWDRFMRTVHAYLARGGEKTAWVVKKIRDIYPLLIDDIAKRREFADIFILGLLTGLQAKRAKNKENKKE